MTEAVVAEAVVAEEGRLRAGDSRATVTAANRTADGLRMGRGTPDDDGNYSE
jgi:hypothetical protein